MPIPEYPQSRSEEYLDAIATGDNSGLPAFPQSRMEQYLEVIAQNGGGSSGGGALVVTCTKEGSPMPTTITANKKCKEIFDAYAAGENVVFLNANVYPDALGMQSSGSLMSADYTAEDGYALVVSTSDSTLSFEGGADDYAVCTLSL